MAQCIIYVQYTNPAGYPPLQHSSRMLADHGWSVLFLGTGSFGAGSFEFPEHPRVQVRRMKFRAAGALQKFHYLLFCVWVLAHTIRKRPAWVYASDLLSCPVTAILAALLKQPVIYHEHDSPSADASGGFNRLCLITRRAVAHRAAVCILPNTGRAEEFRRQTGTRRPIHVVWNCPSRLELFEPSRRSAGKALRVIYHGSIVPDRLPVSVIDAIARAGSDIRLVLVGYETVGSRGYTDLLRERAAAAGLPNAIEVHGALKHRDDVLRVCATCDVGLALMPSQSADLNLAHMAGASNKIFDYLACRVAAIVSDLPEWKELFVDPGYAITCDPNDAASMVAALQWYVDHPEKRRMMADSGRKRIETEWNYEAQFQPIFDLVAPRLAAAA